MAKAKAISIENIKETRLVVELIGDSDLILHKKSRSFERQEIFKQSHEKGTKIPKDYMQSKNIWEGLITGLTWEKPITYHDDDCDLYTEEEWREHMSNNRPCILAPAFYGSFSEAFKTFGFKEATGKAGTDLQRALNLVRTCFPVDFAGVEVEQKLVPNTGINKTNVICCQNVFSGWKCTIELTVADVVFPYETILSVIQTAGTYIGIGTQRKNGYGRYHIGEIQLIK